LLCEDVTVLRKAALIKRTGQQVLHTAIGQAMYQFDARVTVCTGLHNAPEHQRRTS